MRWWCNGDDVGLTVRRKEQGRRRERERGGRERKRERGRRGREKESETDRVNPS